MKKHILHLYVLMILFPYFTFAQVQITEFMYDLSGTDTDREWVEIYNSGNEPVTITTGSGNGSWRFVDNSPHTLTLFSGENILAAGQYAVIAKNSTQFMVDWPSFTGTLFTSAISFPNTTATLSVKDNNGNVLDTFTYNSDMGAKGDGNSLQRNGSSFLPRSPTPGLPNSSEIVVETPVTPTNDSSGSSGSSSATGSSSAHSSPAPINESITKIDFEVYAGRDRITVVGNSLVFQANIIKSQGINEQGINYIWSFGDGSVGHNKLAEHSYRFPGEYNVILNASYLDKQAVSRLAVKVIMPEFQIKKVDGGIELHNKTKQEVNLNGWTFSSKFKNFKFPIDTLVGADKKIIFSDMVTGMSIGEVSLKSPFGEIFSSFSEHKESIDDQKIILEMEQEVLALQSNIQNLEKASQKPSIIPTIQATEIQENTPAPEPDPVLPPVEQNTSARVIFEAEKKAGFVNKMFAIPIKGLDLLISIFK